MTEATIDVTSPAPATERAQWQERAEADTKRKAELLDRVQQMETEGTLKLDAERRELEAERKELLLEGKPTDEVREKLRRNLQGREDLAAEIRELRQAAGGMDGAIESARIKAAQARQAQVAEEAPEAVRELVSAIETVCEAVERVEALRAEDYRLGQIIRQRRDARGGGPGVRGANWSHRYWTRFVKAVEEIQRFEIDAP